MVTSLSAEQQDNGYIGTLEAVLSELACNLSRDDLSVAAFAQRTLHPPRIIRALIDYKIDHPDIPGIEALVQEGIAVALDIYRGSSDAAEIVGGLHATLAASAYAPVLSEPLIQASDLTTRDASHPLRSMKTAEKLAANSLHTDVLFIALGHGGVAAGMGVYLRYCEMTESSGSSFYVARFSTQKKKDTVPHLSPSEIAYLQEVAPGKRVIIFDEDSCSGHTLEAAQKYFRLLFPDNSVEAVANLDVLGALTAAGFASEVNSILENRHNSLSKKHKQIKGLYDIHALGEKEINPSMDYIPPLIQQLKKNQNTFPISSFKENIHPENEAFFLKKSLPNSSEYLLNNS